MSNIKVKLKSALYREWKNQWVNTPLYTHAKNFLDGPDPTAKKLFLSQPKHITRILIQCITGHSVLPVHLHRMGFTTPTICQFCEEQDLDPYHLLRECPAFEETRIGSWGPFIRTTDDYTLKNFLLGLRSFVLTKRVMALFRRYTNLSDQTTGASQG